MPTEIELQNLGTDMMEMGLEVTLKAEAGALTLDQVMDYLVKSLHAHQKAEELTKALIVEVCELKIKEKEAGSNN